MRFLGLSEAGEADHPPGPRGASHRRAAERVLALGAEPGERDHPAAARARHRPGAVQPARPRLPHRHRQAGRGVSRGRLPPGRSALPGRELRRQHARRPRRCSDWRSDKGATPGQVALAWLLHKGDDIVPIPGTKRRRYLEENVAAAALSLSPAEMAPARCGAPAGGGVGPRYNERMMAFIDR